MCLSVSVPLKVNTGYNIQNEKVIAAINANVYRSA